MQAFLLEFVQKFALKKRRKRGRVCFLFCTPPHHSSLFLLLFQLSQRTRTEKACYPGYKPPLSVMGCGDGWGGYLIGDLFIPLLFIPVIPISQVCDKENSNVWQTTPSVYLSWVVGMGKEATSGYLIEDLFVPFVSSPFARSVPKIIPMCDRPLVFICHGLWGWVRRVLHWGPICHVRLIPICQVCAKDNSNVWQTTPSAYLSYVCGYQVKLSLKKVSIYRSMW